jgi:dTDP-4-amino-4,6-dideoxygalactose transaminase
MRNVYDINREFEAKVAEYTGAPYCVTFDNQSNALYSALMFESVKGKQIGCPKHTYPSVPMMIRWAGADLVWRDNDEYLKGAYPLDGSRVWDSALRFTCDMYIPGTLMCLSFTGPHKRLKLGKAGAIITDDAKAVEWLKRFRYNGRNEVSYHEDSIDMMGWNFYLLPEIAAKGLRDMEQFYYEGEPIPQPDIQLPYPDMSEHPVFR